MNMREKIAEAIDQRAHVDENYGIVNLPEVVDAVLDALREAENDMLAAGYEAMFEDKWDGTQAPMMGAGWEAMIAAAKAGR